ncbi:MAG: TonB-dependent receptor [Steroidobacteraceae bacterium]
MKHNTRLEYRAGIRAILRSGGAVLGIAVCAPALGQAGGSTAPGAAGQLEDVVVTARRQTESLISVPVAVTALSAGDINRYNAVDLKKIGQLAPQVMISEAGSGSGASFSIRGIGSSALDAGIQQTVAVNIDGVQVSRGRLVKIGFFDLQQIEVLKGPQALFFGKNSPAGVISMNSINPTGELQGYVRGGYEFVAHERYVEGAVGGPLGESLRARIAIRGSKMDGWIENTAAPRANPYAPAFPLPGALGEDQPGNREVIGRATVVFDPGTAFDANLKVSGGVFKTNTDSNAAQAFCAPGIALPSANGINDTTGDCRLDRYRSSSDIPSGFLVDWPGAPGDGKTFSKLNTYLSSLTMNLKADDITFTSVTGYFYLRNRGFDEFTYTGTGRIWAAVSERTKQFSQELRAVTDFDSAINLTLGGYFEKGTLGTGGGSMVAYLGPDPVTGRFISYDLFTKSRSEASSLFGQLRWDVLENVEVAAGVRYTHEKKKLLHARNDYVRAPLPFLPPSIDLSGTYRDSNWSPEASATWHPTADSTLYAAYKTGYKSGGFSQPGNIPVGTTGAALEFQSESAKGFEVGYKAQFLDRRLRMDLTAYQYDYDDLQLSSFNAATLSYSLRNAAKARTKGVEAAVDWRASPRLLLRAAAGYNRARYRSFTGAPCYAGQTALQGCVAANPAAPTVRAQDLTGRPLTRAPDWSFNVGGNYDVPITGDLTLGLAADANYSDSYYAQENQNPESLQDSFWRLNASVRLASEAAGWEVALIGRNLTNTYYMTTSVDKPAGRPGELGAGLQRPREIALQASYRF